MQTTASESKPADEVQMNEWGRQFRFVLKDISLPRRGAGAVRVTGELQNKGSRTMRVDQGLVSLSVCDNLKFWEVGTPYVYQLRKNPVVPVDPAPSVLLAVVPGSVKKIQGVIGLTEDSELDPLYWFARTRTDERELKEDKERRAVLPSGLYGVSGAVDLLIFEPGRKPPWPFFEVHGENMLWIEVGTDGTARLLTTRPAH